MFVQNLPKFKLASVLFISSLLVLWFSNSFAENPSKNSALGLSPVTLTEATNLASDGRDADKKQLPILIFFSMNHCPFCIEVEEDYLKPMLRNSEYDNKVIIRKVRVDGIADVYDFDGKDRDLEEIGDKYNVSMVPTVILVDANGKALDAPIRGIANSHFYSHELDKAIARSTQKIRAIAKLK